MITSNLGRTRDANLDTVEATLNGMVNIADTPEGRLGCLVCNTSREPIAEDAAVREQIGSFFRRIEAAYRNALDNARRRGELSSTENTQSLARFFLGIHVSLCLLSRAGEPVEVLRDLVREALARVG